MESSRGTKRHYVKGEDNATRQKQRAHFAKFQSGILPPSRQTRQHFVPEFLPIEQDDEHVTSLPELAKTSHEKRIQPSAYRCRYPDPSLQQACAPAARPTLGQRSLDHPDVSSARERQMRDARMACRNSLRPQNDWLRLSALKPVELHFGSSLEPQSCDQNRERTPASHRRAERGGRRHGRSQNAETLPLSEQTYSSPLSKYPMSKEQSMRPHHYKSRLKEADWLDGDENMAATADLCVLTPVQTSDEHPVPEDNDFQVRIGTDAFFSQNLTSRVSPTQATTHLHNLSPASSLLSGETMLLDDGFEEAAQNQGSDIMPPISIDPFACQRDELRKMPFAKPEEIPKEAEFEPRSIDSAVLMPSPVVVMTDAADSEERPLPDSDLHHGSEEGSENCALDEQAANFCPESSLPFEKELDEKRSEAPEEEGDRSWRRWFQAGVDARTTTLLDDTTSRDLKSAKVSEDVDQSRVTAAPDDTDQQVRKSLDVKERFFENDCKAANEPSNMTASSDADTLPSALEEIVEDSSQVPMDDEDMWRRFVIGNESDNADFAEPDARQHEPLRILREGLCSELEDASIPSSSDHASGRATVATSVHPAARRRQTNATRNLPEDSESIWSSSPLEMQTQASMIAQASTGYHDILNDDTGSSSRDMKVMTDGSTPASDVTTYWKRLRTGRITHESTVKNRSKFKPAKRMR